MAKTEKRPTPSTAAEPAASPIDTVARLTLPLTKDNKIDWEKIRPARRDDLRRQLAESGVTATATTGPAPNRSPIVNAALASTFYDLLAQLEAIAAARAFNCTVDQAVTYLRFSETEKATLAEPTIAVLNKYLPASVLDRYADECLLLLLFATMTRAKLENLRVSLAGHESPAEVKMETHKKTTEKGEKP